MNSNTFIPILVLGFACIILGWSLRQTKGFTPTKLLIRLQVLMLVLPWLIYFGLFLGGIFINLATLLALISLASIGYLWLGTRIRKAKNLEADLELNLKSNLGSNLESTTIREELIKKIASSDVKSEAKSDPKTELLLEEKPNPKPDPEDIKKIQGIFGIETFYATEMISYQLGLVFRGNMRGEAAAVYAHLAKGLSDRLGDKYNLFLLQGQDAKPVVMILPQNNQALTETIPQKILAAVLIGSTFLTCLILGAQISNIDLSIHPEQFGVGLPFGFGVILILAVRELGWRWQGKKHKIKLGLPFCLPSSQLGAFGAFSRIQSSLPNRQVLFDLAIAPAIGGGLLSLLFLVIGLILSGDHVGNLQIPSQIFQASVLVGIISKLALGSALHIDLVEIHPLVIIGWIGLIITALNLLPAGQLDGGRIMQALYGRRTAGISTFITLLILAAATLVYPLALYWGGIIIILLRDQEALMYNEITELDDDRDALGIFMLFWMLITLLPMTAVVAEKLGIGG